MTVDETPADTIWMRYTSSKVTVGYSLSAMEYYICSPGVLHPKDITAETEVSVEPLLDVTPGALEEMRVNGHLTRIPRPLSTKVWIEMGELPL
ncbi:MAG TPA: hypothetical protein VEI97_11280 [bacterium]|nr:hypothetical protein [bacterium]